MPYAIKGIIADINNRYGLKDSNKHNRANARKAFAVKICIFLFLCAVSIGADALRAFLEINGFLQFNPIIALLVSTATLLTFNSCARVVLIDLINTSKTLREKITWDNFFFFYQALMAIREIKEKNIFLLK